MDQNPMFNAILKWSLAQQDPEPSRDIKPLSDADKEFLDRAMRSMVINETERMKIISAIIAMPEEGAELVRVATTGTANPTALFGAFDDLTGGTLKKAMAPEVKGDIKATDSAATSTTSTMTSTTSSTTASNTEMDAKALASMVLARKEQALDELDDRVMKIDNATDLHKVGGLIPLIKNITSSYPSLRWRAAQVLGTVVQNNPTAQQWALDAGAMTTLLSVIGTTSTEISLASHHPELPKVLAKAMFALSCLIRQHPASEEAFIKAAGLARLVKLLSAEAAPISVRRKALQLLYYFLTCEDRSHRTTVRTLGAIPVIARLIGNDDVDVSEIAPRALWALCSKEQLEAAAPQFARANVPTLLTNRLAAIASLTEDQDYPERERRACERLLKWLQTSATAIEPATSSTSSPAAAIST